MKTFNEIAVAVLRLAPETIRDDLKPADVPDWDSMNYLLFISELEKEFATSFTMDEVLGAQSLGDVRQLLVKRGITA